MNYYPYSSPYGTPQNRAQYGVPSYGGYNYTTQPQQMQSMPQNQPQAQPQYEMPIQDIRFVTAEEAKAFIVMPNSRVLLIDRSGMAYLKTADNMGQSQTQCFRFEAVNSDGSPIKPQEQPTKPDFKDFVKLNDINKFGFATMEDIKNLGFATTEQVSALSKKIDELQNQRMGVKQNVGTSKPQV
jgi:hypothetical protein